MKMEFELKNKYYQLNLGQTGDKDAVWIKKLKFILESDIHERPLGCKISDTHMKIGEVHLSSFYEAQILFSHARWIRRFSEWLEYRLKEEMQENSCIKKFVVIGYETYIEPVLYTLKQRLEENTKITIQYGIYEEPKFIQNKAGGKTEFRIRYIEEFASIAEEAETQVVFVCGISSTLSTFGKMMDLFWNSYIKKGNVVEKSNSFYTLIQVLPDKNEAKYGLRLERRETQRKIAISEKYNITAQYLVGVNCEWYDANECPLCFPDNPVKEKPIIQTSETSVVPVQMITPALRKHKGQGKTGINRDELLGSKINFFEKTGRSYKYKEYLYYDHIDRMDHHYKYYIRTGHLLRRILNDPEDRKKFEQRCCEIRGKLNFSQKAVNVIISPSHFSDEVFPNVINRYVFDGKAHMISFDPQKEFRSNFETKYSNIAYFIQQTENCNEKVDIRFYYVDDQLVSGDIFYRVKSLVKSLMSKENKLPDNIKVFDAVIILLSRISDSSKADYVDSIENYHSFIDIAISSIRNRGDSCPICKLKQNAVVYTCASSLDVCAAHWSYKYWYHSTKTLEEVKRKQNKLTGRDRKMLQERYLRRMECENILWNKTKKGFSTDDFLQNIIASIYEKKDVKGDIPCEYLISFVKAIAVPFLYYKENEKKAAMKILLELITQAKSIKSREKTTKFCVNGESLSVRFDSNAERYSLIIVLLNCLAEVDSTYLLDVHRIIELCNIVKKIDENLLGYKKVTLDGVCVEGFFGVVVVACKRIMCGISGDSKIRHMDIELEKILDSAKCQNEMLKLWKVLYLENTNKSARLKNLENEYEQKHFSIGSLKKMKGDEGIRRVADVVKNYSRIAEMLRMVYGNDKTEVHFFYYDSGLETNWFHLYIDENERLGEIGNAQVELLERISEEGVAWNASECVVRMHYYDIDEFNLQTDLRNKDDEILEKKDVYLYLKFEGMTEKEQLAITRNILQYRHALCKIIAGDISTDAIRGAIQAKASEYLLKSDKALSHGAEEELSSLLQQVANLIEICHLQKDTTNADEYFLNACNGINIFMNRCISYLNTHQIIRQYFTLHNSEEKIKQSPFANSVQSIHISEWIQGWYFFERYLQEISNSSSKYIKKLVEKSNNVSEVKIGFANGIDEFRNEIQKYNTVPFFLNAGGADSIHSIIFLIGIMDVFIRNAIKHGVTKNKEINIDFKLQGNSAKIASGAIGYKLVAINETKKSKDAQGITKKFFEIINKEKKGDDRNYFQVKFYFPDSEERDIYHAELEVIREHNGSEEQ